MIELKGVCKAFGQPPVAVLNNVSMEFKPGITCIMGPSGVGKTTLARIIAGSEKPDSGEVIGAEGLKVSMVFQEDRLLDWETALSNVLFVASFRERAIQLLTQAGLADSLTKKAGELSGGMRRRVCICRALIADYDLLILDEPFKGLDSGIKCAIMQMVMDSVAGKIVVCITHDREEAEFLAGENVIQL